MAVFNKRQVGYIKAIAGVGKHKSFIHKRYDNELSAVGLPLSLTNSRVNTGNKKCTVLCVPIHKFGIACNPRDSGDDISAWNQEVTKMLSVRFPSMNLLDCPAVVEGKEDLNNAGSAAPNSTPTINRVGTEYFLDNTHIRMRFTMPDFQVATGLQPHHEYRLIVFRARKPQASHTSNTSQDPATALHGATFINFWYDLFSGYVGRRTGIAGWRKHLEFDGTQHYNGLVENGTATDFTTTGQVIPIHPPGEGDMSPDDLMTIPLNDADYIIKTDERFFLGPEHGKSHFEKTIAFDWNQRGDWASDDMAQGLEPGFNPLWNILLIATSNDQQTPKLNVLIRGTTHVESA